MAPAVDLPIAATASTPSFEPVAHITIGGQRIQLAPGMAIKQLARQSDQTCGPADYEIEVHSPKELPFGRVTIGTDANCLLVVQEVFFSLSPRVAEGHDLPAGLKGLTAKAQYLGPLGFVADATTHEIYGRHVYHEQFHATVSLAHSQYTYDDNGSSVSSPTGTSEYCWAAGTGWSIDNCYATLDSAGPTLVQKTTVGSFSQFPLGLAHTLQGHARAFVGSNDATCTFTGSPPPFWHDHCEYGRFY